MRSRGGFTLAEVMVTLFVFGLLSVLLLQVFIVGSSAWQKGEANAQMLQEFQVLSARLSREVRNSTVSSLSFQSDGAGSTLALLSADDANGVFQYEPSTGRPQWQKYLVFYFLSAERKVYLREETLSFGSPEIDDPEPIEDYDAGSGNLADYRNGGRLLMSDVDAFGFVRTDFLLEFTVEASRERYGSNAPEKLAQTGRCFFRN